MSVNHEAVSALPVGGPADAALIRAMCERRFAYSLSASEVSTNLVVVDPASGVVPLYLLQNSTLFAYDSTDSTTTHDGVTCLVSFEGKRFKSGTISPPYSVLTRSTTAQPASPAVGDRYLIPMAATGTDWSGQDGKIGIYTAAGWRFAVSPIGRFLYIEDQTAFYHRNAAGTWTAGVGSLALGAGSVTLQNVLGANASYVVKVENQSTNAPPASPTAPTAYIIGPSPTGAWSGNAGKLAICLVNGAFTIIAPAIGDQIYDKNLNALYNYTGSSWQPQAGAWSDFWETARTVSASTSGGNSVGYTYDPTANPAVGTSIYLDDLASLTFSARRTGQVIWFEYSGEFTGTLNTIYTFALYKDSDVVPIGWTAALCNNISWWAGRVRFRTAAVDASSHTYKIRAHWPTGATLPTLLNRYLTAEGRP